MNNPLTLKEKSLLLPSLPGVYLFKDTKGVILYVGKAKNLKKRIAQYFAPGRDDRMQIPFLIEAANNIDFILTDNERDALLLEDSLIKKHKPTYNICLKDDKTYKSIFITTENEFPGISIVRKKNGREKGIFFGPYCNEGKKVNDALLELVKIFKIRDCRESEFLRRRKSKRPCLKYQIKQCSAPCAGYISNDDYQQSVVRLIDFLKGKNISVERSIKKDIELLSEKLEFEKANELFEKLKAFKNIVKNSSAVSGFKDDADAIASYLKGNHLVFMILFVRAGKIISSTSYHFENVLGDPDIIYLSFIEQFYMNILEAPKWIWVDLLPADKKNLEKLLSEKSKHEVRITKPLKGAKFKLINLAKKNAASHFKRKILLLEKNKDLYSRFSKVFRSANLYKKIECFDISHSSGKDQTGVKVEFRDFKAYKEGYRRYSIKTVKSSPDDVKSMYEVVYRRLKRGADDGDLPDLLVVDGGVAQLNAALKAKAKLRLNLKIIALVKESHSKNSRDSVIVENRKNPLPLKFNDPVLLKLMEIRDEAHRFAIAYHKNVEKKRIFKK